eukprot:435430-Alexandrium_andersonii.AAC.1
MRFPSGAAVFAERTYAQLSLHAPTVLERVRATAQKHAAAFATADVRDDHFSINDGDFRLATFV